MSLQSILNVITSINNIKYSVIDDSADKIDIISKMFSNDPEDQDYDGQINKLLLNLSDKSLEEICENANNTANEIENMISSIVDLFGIVPGFGELFKTSFKLELLSENIESINNVITGNEEDKIIGISNIKVNNQEIHRVITAVNNIINFINSTNENLSEDGLNELIKKNVQIITLLNTINDALTNDIPVRRLKFTPEEEKMIKSFNLLTSKPIIYIANIKESDIGLENEYTKLVRDYALKDNADVIEMCAKIESEISSLDDEERTLFLNELGIKESGLDSLIKSTYSLLGLRTFFTVGTDEVRAWTFKKGMKAPECAGIIHTDFQKGFIKAEVMSYDDLIECGSETKVKESGKMRLEGKEYEMQDGDICHFRFNK